MGQSSEKFLVFTFKTRWIYGFAPFTPMQYRREVHDAIYRCVAANVAGKIGSREVRVRADGIHLAVNGRQHMNTYHRNMVSRGNFEAGIEFICVLSNEVLWKIR
ncbi:hypothetical protein TNIN_316041 [Trichonephila inaurata madagascariensis]|uniref:Uncharacterized protein n=1 Tax=Trichonephila inaurata madagascariensis TaxID=2747483 RepID=A0A8X6YN22_9ARAC|nr:hypothetical protein TNIN_316041 [Trichonephila inaurata madagascariensis]